MEELDELRLQHAEAMLAKGRASLASDANGAYYDIWSARMLMIATELKVSGELPVNEVRSIVDETVDCVRNRGVDLHLEKQNELLLLALAAMEHERASLLAHINCTTDQSHGFDIQLNRRLRSFFRPLETSVKRQYTPSKTERLLFDDLDAISRSQFTDLSGTDRYWNATKSKRYSNTAFQRMNFFRPALEQLKHM